MWKRLLLTLAVGGIPGLAAAEPGSRAIAESARSTVHLGGVDGTSAAGERDAQARIHRAAVRLCNGLANPSRADDRALIADCVHDAQVVALAHLQRLMVLRAAVNGPSRE